MTETNYPLLVFPEPAHAERAKRHGGAGKSKVPDVASQTRRLALQFQRLQEAMDKQRIALQGNPIGLQPEQILILETVGSIQDFIRAVEKISGLEWLDEYELDDIVPDHGFEDKTNPDKELKGQLFVVMTDQQALSQLRSLFEGWQRNPDAKFQRGLAPLKKVFQHLYTIRPWDIEDRIRETGILEDWRFRLEHMPEDVPFEVELWFRRSPIRRQMAETRLRSIIESHRGTVVQQCVIPEINYHGILGRMPRAQAQMIMEDQTAFRDIGLLRCEDIMHIRPVGQCGFRSSGDTETEQHSDDELASLLARSEPAVGSPVVALLDGMPLTRHRLLDNRITVDDPDGYETAYQAHERIHGTMMASLICHGDLNQQGNAVETPLYVRPILKPQSGIEDHVDEVLPEDILPVDLVHRSVRRMFAYENGEPPVAPDVRVINLSVCDRSRPLFREMSPWARLLDWLSWKHKILFIVSAGNHLHDLELEVPRHSLSELSPTEWEQAVIRALVTDARNRRLLSPAETINGLTVGASHDDASPLPPVARLTDPFVHPNLPSVFSAHGPGYRGAMKPEIYLPGGRQFVRERPDTTHPNTILETPQFVSPPGQRVATPGTAGQLSQTQYTRGTSNAAALASRGANALFHLIGELRDQSGNQVPAEYNVMLIKALLVHSADWEDTKEQYTNALRTPDNSRMLKDYLGRFLGYGSANLAKVMTCTEQRITVLGFGELDDGEGAVFRLPLPPSLLAESVTRRLTITLAWLSPTKVTRQNYRVAHLWFDPKSELAPERRFADHRAVQRGTVQHEVLEGDKAMAFEDGDAVEIKVNCRADAGNIPAPISYGLAVTLEVAESIALPIYEEVRDRLAVRVPVQEVGVA